MLLQSVLLFYYLENRTPISIQNRTSHRIAILPTRIARVPLYGVDVAILYLFHNAHMIGERIVLIYN